MYAPSQTNQSPELRSKSTTLPPNIGPPPYGDAELGAELQASEARDADRRPHTVQAQQARSEPQADDERVACQPRQYIESKSQEQ